MTVIAVPDAGYVLDSGYYSAKGRFGQMFYESMVSPFKVTIDQEKHIGVSFIEKTKVDHLNVIQDVAQALGWVLRTHGRHPVESHHEEAALVSCD